MLNGQSRRDDKGVFVRQDGSLLTAMSTVLWSGDDRRTVANVESIICWRSVNVVFTYVVYGRPVRQRRSQYALDCRESVERV